MVAPHERADGLRIAYRHAAMLNFRARFEEHAPFVRHMLRRLGVSYSDSDDLVQEIFFVVHRKLHAYDGSAPFRSWLYGICIRMVSTYRRSARFRHERTEAFGVLDARDGSMIGDPERCLEMRRACMMLEGLLVHLDDDQREVFVLFEIEGRPMTEVSEMVGCPVQTAYSRLHAARKGMRALVARHRAADEDGLRVGARQGS